MPIKEVFNVKRISVKPLNTENEKKLDQIIKTNNSPEIKKFENGVCKSSKKV